MTDLSRVGDRSKLKPQREPHWQRLRAGCFLGFRPSKRGGKGKWIARVYDEDRGRYLVKSLGDYGALPGNEMFTAAKRDTESLAELVESGGNPVILIETVADACREYAASRPDAEGRFKRHVYHDPIAKTKLGKLRRRHLQEWRKRLEEKPALVTRRKNGENNYRTRAASSVNRDMAALRAALADRLPLGDPHSDSAWQEALKPTPHADGRRTLYLDRKERTKLLAETDAEAEPFVRALCLLPLRPGALASLRSCDFEKRTNELTVGKDKNGKPRRVRLPSAAAQLVAKQAQQKPPGAPIFVRSNGKQWDRHTWKKPIRAAAQKAGLPTDTTAYTLRHSTITDLVMAGLPLLTIAQISGTSAEMIERHYGHLTSEAALQALDTLAL